MNIFFLSETPQQAAEYQCDKHIVKMITESAQMISTWYLTSDFEFEDDTPWYRPTHINHPCVKWLSESTHNVLWLVRHLRALLNEYDRRFHKKDKFANARIILSGVEIGLSYFLLDEKMTLPPLCMPEEYRVTPCNTMHDVVASYRAYYTGDKAHMFKYTNVEWPSWLLSSMVERPCQNKGDTSVRFLQELP